MATWAGKALRSGLEKFYPGVPLREAWEAIRETWQVKAWRVFHVGVEPKLSQAR
jgi:hypothetical protein